MARVALESTSIYEYLALKGFRGPGVNADYHVDGCRFRINLSDRTEHEEQPLWIVHLRIDSHPMFANGYNSSGMINHTISVVTFTKQIVDDLFLYAQQLVAIQFPPIPQSLALAKAQRDSGLEAVRG